MTQPGTGTIFSLAMSVGMHGSEATLKNPLSRVDWFGLCRKAATVVVDALVESARGWPGHFRSAGCPDDEIQALATSFERLDSVECGTVRPGSGGLGDWRPESCKRPHDHLMTAKRLTTS